MIRQTITQISDILTFGKHKYQTIQHVLRTDPSYIIWLNYKEIVKFPQEIVNQAEDAMEDQGDYSYEDEPSTEDYLNHYMND